MEEFYEVPSPEIYTQKQCQHKLRIRSTLIEKTLVIISFFETLLRDIYGHCQVRGGFLPHTENKNTLETLVSYISLHATKKWKFSFHVSYSRKPPTLKWKTTKVRNNEHQCKLTTTKDIDLLLAE